MGEDVVCLDNLCQGMRGNDMKMDNNKTTQEVEKKRESTTRKEEPMYQYSLIIC